MWHGKKASAAARIRGGIAVALVAVGVALAPVAQAADQTARFVSQLRELKVRQDARVAALGKRYQDVDLESIIDAPALVTPEGRAASKARVVELRGLIAEIEALENSGLVEAERIITSMPEGPFKRGALQGFNAKKPAMLKLMADMQQGQVDIADSVDAIIDWCAAQGDALKLEGNQFVLTPTQMEEWQAMLVRLGDAGKRTEAAAARLQERSTNADRQMAEFERSMQRGGK